MIYRSGYKGIKLDGARKVRITIKVVGGDGKYEDSKSFSYDTDGRPNLDEWQRRVDRAVMENANE